MKVGKSENMKNQNPSYILGYLLELIIKIWRIWTIFFSWKILCIGRNHILKFEIWRDFAKEKNLLAMIFLAENFAKMRENKKRNILALYI
jgi:hypothetical protein